MARILEDYTEITERLIPSQSATPMLPNFQRKPGKVDQEHKVQTQLVRKLNGKVVDNFVGVKKMPSASEDDIELGDRSAGPSASTAKTPSHLQQSSRANVVQIDERSKANASAGKNYKTVKTFRRSVWNEDIGSAKNTPTSTPSDQGQAILTGAELNGQAAEFDDPELSIQIVEHEICTRAELVNDNSNKSSDHNFVGQIESLTATNESEKSSLLRKPPATTSRTSLDLQPLQQDEDVTEADESSNHSTTLGIDNETLRIFHDAVDREDISFLEKTLNSLPSDQSRAKLLNSIRPGDEHGEVALHRVLRMSSTKLLFKHGASIREKRNGTALHHVPISLKDQSGLESSTSDQNPTIIDVLINAGANVNAEDNDGYTPLLLSVFDNNVAAAKFLLERGASVTGQDHCGMTPLHHAAIDYRDRGLQSLVCPKLTIFDALIEAGAHVNAQDYDGRTPLHQAALNNNQISAELLIKHGADVNVRDKCSVTALHYFARSFENQSAVESSETGVGRTIFDALIEAGADVNAQDYDGRTPLHHAVLNNNQSSAELLIKHDADVNKRDKLGCTPLHTAVKYFKSKNEPDPLDFDEKCAVIEALLVAGADVNAQDTDGRTPLHHAVLINNQSLAKLLIKRGADVNERDKLGCTPLHTAVKYFKSKNEPEPLDFDKKCAVIEALLVAGADVDAQDLVGEAPLHYAAAENNVSAADILIKYGANANIQDHNGWTPLQHIAKYFESETEHGLSDFNKKRTILDTLWEAGADVHAQDRKGRTPIHQAVANNDGSLTKLLLQHGANANIRDHTGCAPLHLIGEFSETRTELRLPTSADYDLMLIITHMLIEAGADINAKDKEGDTPLHKAVLKQNQTAVVHLLERPGIRPNIQNGRGYLPLHYARMSFFAPKIVRLLLDTVLQRIYLTWNLKTDRGESLLHLAALGSHSQLVTEILDHEICTKAKLVRVDDTDKFGDTALHYACRDGRYEICKKLLKYATVESLSARNNSGMSLLDVAGSGGHQDICALLLRYEAFYSRLINARALMLACESGQAETVRYFVQNCEFNLYDERAPNEPNLLSRAIETNHDQVARYIVQDSPVWQNGLCNHTMEGETLDTPMRALIRTMPDVARQVLNRCTDLTDTRVRFKFEFVDDAYSTWQPRYKTWDGNNPAFSAKNSKRHEILIDSPYTSNARELQNNHVLSQMVKYDRDDLLKHPLVSTLIGQKWRKFGRTVFLISFIAYVFHLVLLSFYSISAVPVNSLFHTNKTFHPFWIAKACNGSDVVWTLGADSSKFSEDEVCRVIEEHRALTHDCSTASLIGLKSDKHQHFVRFLLLFSSVAMLAGKLAWFIVLPTLSDFLACCVGILTIVITIPWHGLNCFHEFGLMQSWTWQVASVNIFLAYVCFALHLEFLPGLGIYVHMLKDISRTMLRVLTGPFGIILSALALCFFMIFKSSVRHDQYVKLLVGDTHDHSAEFPLNPFYSFPKALLKTLVMFIGEYDLADHFTVNDVLLAPIMLMLLVLFGTIALMNLLIGLATSDVDALQDQAEAQQLKTQITYALSVQRLIRISPLSKYSYFKNLVRSDYISYYSLDGRLLEQKRAYATADDGDGERDRYDNRDKTNSLNSRASTLSLNSIAAWLRRCYYQIFVDPRYTTTFSTRLQQIALEKSKSTEDASRSKRSTDNASRVKEMALETKQIKKAVGEVGRAKNENGVTLNDLPENSPELMGIRFREMEARIMARLDYIAGRLPEPTAQPNNH